MSTANARTNAPPSPGRRSTRWERGRWAKRGGNPSEFAHLGASDPGLAGQDRDVKLSRVVPKFEPAHTLGDRSRTLHVRFGVVNAGIALGFGLFLAESGSSRGLAWLIALPLGLAAYGLLAGALGVCAMTGL